MGQQVYPLNLTPQSDKFCLFYTKQHLQQIHIEKKIYHGEIINYTQYNCTRAQTNQSNLGYHFAQDKKPRKRKGINSKNSIWTI